MAPAPGFLLEARDVAKETYWLPEPYWESIVKIMRTMNVAIIAKLLYLHASKRGSFLVAAPQPSFLSSTNQIIEFFRHDILFFCFENLGVQESF